MYRQRERDRDENSQRNHEICACVCAVWLSYPCLEAAVQLGEVGVSAGEGQDALLRHGTVDIVILQDYVFLQHFDGVNLLCPLELRQHHLDSDR